MRSRCAAVVQPQVVGSTMRCTRARSRGVVLGTALLIAAALGSPARAQTPSVMLTSSPAPLAIRDAVAGFAPNSDTDAGARLTVVAVEGSSRLYVHTDTPLPADVTLRIRVEAPAGALAMGFVMVGDAPQELITGIPAGTHSALTITFELSAATQAGTIALSSCNVVFTITDGPV